MMFAAVTPVQIDDAAADIERGAFDLWETFVDALPRLGVAVTFIVVGWLIARAVRWLLARHWGRRHTPSFATVMSKLVSWILVGWFTLAAATVTFPSVKPVDLLAGLGFFSIAIGFAFQDILENTLSGVLLLFREPFHAGDQIEVEGAEGTVEAITIRETRIVTYDGRLVVVPNSDVYKNAIVVRTEHEHRRDNFVVGIAYEADLAPACRTIEEAVQALPSVDAEPAVEALVTELGAATVNIDVRFWTDPGQHNVVRVRSEAIIAAKEALDRAGIEMPCDIVALQATNSFAAALHGTGELTPGGSVAS